MATPSLPPTMGGTSSSSSFEMKPEDFRRLQTLPGNLECVNCGNPQPDWGCPKLGVLFCFQCSGLHRGLGTHISFVRSVTLDSWQPAQLRQMTAAGGNRACLEFLQRHGINIAPAPRGRATRQQLLAKYDTAAAELWRRVVQARAQGRPEPTKVPKDYQPISSNDNSNDHRPMKAVRVDPSRLQGFGSSPPPQSNNNNNTTRTILLIFAVVVVIAVVAITVTTGGWQWMTGLVLSSSP